MKDLNLIAADFFTALKRDRVAGIMNVCADQTYKITANERGIHLKDLQRVFEEGGKEPTARGSGLEFVSKLAGCLRAKVVPEELLDAALAMLRGGEAGLSTCPNCGRGKL